MALYEVYVISSASSGVRSRYRSSDSFARVKGYFLSAVADDALEGSEATLIMRCSGRAINLYSYSQPAEKIVVRSF